MRVAMPSIMRAMLARIATLMAPLDASAMALVHGLMHFCEDIIGLVPNGYGGMKPYGGVLFGRILVTLVSDDSRIQTDGVVLLTMVVASMFDYSGAFATFAGEAVPNELVNELEDYGGAAEADATLGAFLQLLDIPHLTHRLGPAAARSTSNRIRLLRLTNLVPMVTAGLIEGRHETAGRRALLRIDGLGVFARYLAFIAGRPFVLDMEPGAETVNVDTVLPGDLAPAQWNRGGGAQQILITLALLLCGTRRAPLPEQRALLTSVIQRNLLWSAASVAGDVFRVALANAHATEAVRAGVQRGESVEGGDPNPASNVENPPIGHVIRHLLELATGAPDLAVALGPAALDAAIVASDGIEAEVVAAGSPRQAAVASLRPWSILLYRLGVGAHEDARFCVHCCRRRSTIQVPTREAAIFVYACSDACLQRCADCASGSI